jgi:hypothetical protein
MQVERGREQRKRAIMRYSIGVGSVILLISLAAGCARKAPTATSQEPRQHPVPVSKPEATPLAGSKPEATPRASTETPEDPRRHSEVVGGFSFVPPDGWPIQTMPGVKFKVATGPAANGFAPNINIVDEPFNGSLDAYAQANLATLQRVLKQFRLLKEDKFTTAKGMRSLRMAVEHEFQGKPLHQTFYFFSNGAAKIVVTCSALPQDSDRLARVFETAMRTFRFDRE